MVKIDLITGFLGSGKTTFIKKYAKYLIDSGKNIGILENDYGAVNVDMMLLQDLMGDQCELEMVSGGCDKDCHRRRFKTKLIAMGMCGYDRVIVEPSGIFDVDEFFDALREDPLDKWYEIGNVIAIADAGLPEQMSKDAEYLLGSEAADAGLVFVSKLDESSKEQSDTILPHINRAMEAISCTRKLSEEDVMKKKWDELTKDDWNRILTCGYYTESWQKRDVEDDKSFSSLSFMNLPLTKEQILNAATQILGDPSCGHVHRIKGFLETTDGWFELNATAAQRQLNPIANGQQIIIVIGEGLNKEKIEAYLQA